MSYIDEELKIGTEEDDVDVEEDLNDPLSNIPEEDNLSDDEFAGLIDTEY